MKFEVKWIMNGKVETKTYYELADVVDKLNDLRKEKAEHVTVIEFTELGQNRYIESGSYSAAEWLKMNNNVPWVPDIKSIYK